jgi:alpha-tubulin suppressor-like RCC1 family protein
MPGPAVEISAGYAHTCAVLESGDVFCWGSNTDAQIATAATGTFFAPHKVDVDPKETRFIAVAAGSAHTCAVTDAHTVYCWGSNTEGQCGIDSTAPGLVGPWPVQALDGVVSVETVKDHTCAKRDAPPTMMCWGSNRLLGPSGVVTNKLGSGAQGLSHSAGPVPVDLGSPVFDIGIGAETTFAKTLDGRLLGWGHNRGGVTGTQHPIDGVVLEPSLVMSYRSTQVVAPFVDVIDVLRSSGSGQCGELIDESLYEGHYLCWGHDEHGELGFNDPSTVGKTQPVAMPVKALDRVRSARKLVRGEHFACAVTHEADAYEVWCYGKQGMLGNGVVDDGAVARPDQLEAAPVVWNPDNFSPFLR